MEQGPEKLLARGAAGHKLAVHGEGAMPDQLFSLEGKTALVTGASSGIGRMIAAGLVRRGVRTCVTSRRAEDALKAAAELSAGGGTCAGLAADLGEPDGPARLAQAFAAREGQLDVLVNNAGAGEVTAIAEMAPEGWDAVMDVNLRGAFFLAQQLLPQLRAGAAASPPARIINIGSIGGLHVPGWEAHAYGASKAALHHLTRSLAKRLGREGITVNAIAPGPFPSRLTDTSSEAVKKSVATHIPLNRPGEPEDIEGLVVFLAARAGAYVNGATIPLDGGYIAAL
jgi:NAD(P)-dependent dehydrogenase (short-subunit alcohol dehydrogenase family)